MTTTIELPPYEAMEAKDRQAKLGFVVRLAGGERLYLKYPDVHLVRLSPDQTVLAVFCYSVNIVMWGYNLLEVADALHSGHIAWMQEFDAAQWARPTDPKAALIERIVPYNKKDEDGPQPEISDAAPENRARH